MMIVRFLTGPALPGTMLLVGVYDTWGEALNACAVFGGFVTTVSERRLNEMEKCFCGRSARPNSELCEQCERKIIDGQKPAWAVKGRDGVEAPRSRRKSQQYDLLYTGENQK